MYQSTKVENVSFCIESQDELWAAVMQLKHQKLKPRVNKIINNKNGVYACLER